MMQEVYDFLKKAGTYYLATVEGDQPRVRPFGTVNEFEGKLYIQTGKKKDVSKRFSFSEKIICMLTLNGHLIPGFLLRQNGIVSLEYVEHARLPAFFLKKNVLVVNHYNNSCITRTHSKKLFFKNIFMYIKSLAYFIISYRKIKKDFKNSYNYMTSEEFWKKFLNLE